MKTQHLSFIDKKMKEEFKKANAISQNEIVQETIAGLWLNCSFDFSNSDFVYQYEECVL